VRIDFCEADVLDVFDDWRRATGLAGRTAAAGEPAKKESLPAHLERVVLRLTDAIVGGALGSSTGSLDGLTRRVSLELDAARAAAGGLRGAARRAVLERLAALDAELLTIADAALDEAGRQAIQREAADELAGFRDRLKPDDYQRAHASLVDRHARAHFGLPVIAF
jgi:hypothetical protein